MANIANKNIKENSVTLPDETVAEISALYAEGKYEELLTSSAFQQGEDRAWLQNIDLLEKIVDSIAKVYHPEKKGYRLNWVQRELISTNTTDVFLTRYKKPFDSEVLKVFSESSIHKLDWRSVEVKYLVQQISCLKNCTKRNDTFVSLTERFAAIGNELSIYLLFIRALRTPSGDAMRKCIREYCQLLKAVNEAPYPNCSNRINKDEQIDLFIAFLNIIQKREIIFDIKLGKEKGKESGVLGSINDGININILSVFIDLTGKKDVKYLQNVFAENTECGKLIRLIERCATIDEIEVAQLIKSTLVSDLIYIKAISSMWDDFSDGSRLSDDHLKLLAWSVKYGSKELLDEIVKHHKLKYYTKKQKELALCSSLSSVIDLMESEESMYPLACYIVKHVIPNQKTEELSLETIDVLKKWDCFSNGFYDKIIKNFEQLSKENEENFLTILSLFTLDELHYSLLQEKYSQWFMSIYSFDALGGLEGISLLEKLESIGAYRAFCAVYEKVEGKIEREGVLLKWQPKYIEALIKKQNFNKAINYALDSNNVDWETRDYWIIKIVANNFQKFGLSNSAMAIFNNRFSLDKAIEIIERRFRNTQNKQIKQLTEIVVSLMALYVKNDELIKTIYLNSIYRNKTFGYAQLFSQLNRSSGAYLQDTKMPNHYYVLELSFKVLSGEKLFEFWKWCADIPLTLDQEYTPQHPLSYYFDKILEDPCDIKGWKIFVKGLLVFRNGGNLNQKAESSNGWLLCSCINMLMDKFQVPPMQELHDVYQKMMLSPNISEIPENFLFLIANYIVKTDNESLCMNIYSMLKDEKTREIFTSDNLWQKYKAQDLQAFLDYCRVKMENTKKSEYLELITFLKKDLNYNELVALYKFSSNRKFLVKTICQAYLEGRDADETIETLLKDEVWSNLTYREQEVYNVLSILYKDSSYLIMAHPFLFDSEEDVNRIKMKCATILLNYPSGKEFKQFDLETINTRDKFVVESILMGVFYDEDIFEKYYKGLDCQIFENDKIEYAYISFLKKCFYAQLAYNASYEFFYKRWRYYKLVLVQAWESNVISTNEVLLLVKKNRHEDIFDKEEFQKFCENLERILSSSELDGKTKNTLCFGLLIENVSIFSSELWEKLSKTNEEVKESIRQVVRLINFRNINEIFLKNIIPGISIDTIEVYIKLSEIISTETMDIMKTLALSKSFVSDLKLLKKKVLGETRGQCINNIFKMDADDFESHKELIVPILCSRQVPSKIIDTIRRLIVEDKQFLQNYSYIAKYLKKIGYESAEDQFAYLRLLHACKTENIIEAEKIILEYGDNLFDKIPQEWEKESFAIREYIRSKGETTFNCDDSILYRDGEGKKNRFLSSFEKIKEYYANLEENEFVGYDLKIKGWKNTNGEDGPQYSELIRWIFVEENSLALEVRLFVLLDFYSNNCISREEAREYFGFLWPDLKNGNLSIGNWLTHYRVIEKLVYDDEADSNDRLGDICGAIEKSNLFSSEVSSIAYRLSTIQEICKRYAFGDEYCNEVKNVLQYEKERIEENLILKIKIENASHVQDGHVYFTIQNIGNKTVDFSKENYTIKVIIKDATTGKTNESMVSISNIVELRPGWLTGAKANLTDVLGEEGFTRSLECRIQLYVNKIFVCESSETLAKHTSSGLNVDEIGEYNDIEAVLEGEKLYGRDEVCKNLIKTLKNGKSIVYGPSRIGKSSLLNWLVSEKGIKEYVAYTKTNNKVITISLGKDYDWDNLFYSEDSKIDYTDNTSVTKYILVDSLKYGLTKPRRTNIPAREIRKLPFYESFVKCFENNVRIDDLYCELDDILKESGYEIWVVFDEFQQVLEKWENPDLNRLGEICGYLGRDISNIKTVFCGSDELLRQMILTQGDLTWSKNVFSRAGGVPVGRIDVKDFCEMIREDPAVKKSGIKFSNSAVEALCSYTDRIPLYGKEICNVVLSNLKKNKNLLRDTIYCSDIAEATQSLLKRQNFEQSSKIAKILRAITKGLEEEKPYLLRMAEWFKINSGKAFPHREFAKWNGRSIRKEAEEKLDNILTVVGESGRGIISKTENGDEYVFSNVFYHNAFCGDGASFASLYDERKEQTKGIDDIVDFLKEVPERDMASAISRWHSDLGEDSLARKDMEEHFSKNITYDNRVQNYVQINAQTINAAMTTLLSGGNATDYLKAFDALPSLPKLITPDIQERLDACETDQDREGITRPIENRMVGESVGAALMNPNFLSGLDSMKKAELVGLYDEEQQRRFVERFEKLDSRIKDPLSFAFMLHNIMDEIYKQADMRANSFEEVITDEERREIRKKADELDFCPVALMYCKVVENMLKIYHLDLYAKRLPKATVSGRLYTFEQVIADKNLQDKELTIASFADSIVVVNKDTRFLEYGKRRYGPELSTAWRDGKQIDLKENRRVLSSGSLELLNEWTEHAKAIKVIHGVRNRSAHEIGIISKDVFDWLIEVLFKDGDIFRIVELAEKCKD